MINSWQQASFNRSYLGIFLNVTLGLLFLGSAGTIFWGADRSLGFADEGLYLLAARYPEEIQQNVSSVYIYTGYLFRMVNFDVVAFRLAGVVLICMSALVFWFGFYKFTLEFYPRARVVGYLQLYSLLFMELGALLQYQWFYLTPSYNTLISVAINIFSGSFLYGFSKTRYWRERKRTILFAFAAGGACIGLALFTKFPAGICLILLSIIAILFWSGMASRQKVSLLMAVLIGVVVWASGHFIFVQSLQTWWSMLKDGWNLYQAFGAHIPRQKSSIYIADLIIFSYSAVKLYWPCHLLVWAVYLCRILGANDKRLNDRTNSLVVSMVVLIAALLSIHGGISIEARKLSDGSIPLYLLFHLGWILLLISIWVSNYSYKFQYSGKRRLMSADRNSVIVLGLLIGLPVAGAIGTSNPLYSLPLCYATTWFGAILLLLITSPVDPRPIAMSGMISILSISAFTTSQIVQGYIFDPQGIARNLLQQVEDTSIGFPVSNLKLDLPTHELIKDLTLIAKSNGFKPGGDIIALSYIPGLVYAMGGKSPGHPTFLVGPLGVSDKMHVEEYSRLALHFADIDRLRGAFVLLSVDAGDVEALLTRRGLNFPKEYVKLGASVCSGVEFSLWKPVNFTAMELQRK